MPGPTSTMEIGGDGVAVIRLQNPPVNALHPDGKASTGDARKPRRSMLCLAEPLDALRSLACISFAHARRCYHPPLRMSSCWSSTSGMRAVASVIAPSLRCCPFKAWSCGISKAALLMVACRGCSRHTVAWRCHRNDSLPFVRAVLTALFNNLREAQASDRVRAIVLTGANGRFRCEVLSMAMNTLTILCLNTLCCSDAMSHTRISRHRQPSPWSSAQHGVGPSSCAVRLAANTAWDAQRASQDHLSSLNRSGSSGLAHDAAGQQRNDPQPSRRDEQLCSLVELLFSDDAQRGVRHQPVRFRRRAGRPRKRCLLPAAGVRPQALGGRH